MRLFRHTDPLPDDARGAVVALGNFDGVHFGHQTVINEAARIARGQSLPHAVLTLEPHPRSVLYPDEPRFRLTPLRLKSRQIEALGADILFVFAFDLEFSKKSAEAFVRKVLVEQLSVRHVVSGHDFVFGHGGKGNAALLARLAEKHEFAFTEVVPQVDASGQKYSSTRIRDALVRGDPRTAALMLGRSWEVEGRVERGEGRGHAVGFPTANLHLGDYLQPALGVYAIRAGVDQGGATAWHDGVANLGHRPTFGGEEVLLEVHLFDYSDDLYGRHLRTQLVDYVRPELKFSGPDELVRQIRHDVERVKRTLAGTSPVAPARAACSAP
jgi:riboflavin kinase/FMN adenylyltransferase